MRILGEVRLSEGEICGVSAGHPRARAPNNGLILFSEINHGKEFDY